MRSTLLVSVHPRFAEAILSGRKRVELRRRMPRVGRSETVLLYATVPCAALVGSFEVGEVLREPLRDLWQRVKGIAEVTRGEYADYFRGLTEGVGIFVASASRLEYPIPLCQLRQVWQGFHPPQGFRYNHKPRLGSALLPYARRLELVSRPQGFLEPGSDDEQPVLRRG